MHIDLHCIFVAHLFRISLKHLYIATVKHINYITTIKFPNTMLSLPLQDYESRFLVHPRPLNAVRSLHMSSTPLFGHWTCHMQHPLPSSLRNTHSGKLHAATTTV
ncbi:unnamed protein product [Ceratitis capitata]|uniref:(Mediterranean fruit fly) hypothetical protein n=1 Tax=Ceratitis capitata TaxID=7213 RepID=A0A811UWU0_CERCA|nr:unnamed protein product [Ceratitis capitata]